LDPARWEKCIFFRNPLSDMVPPIEDEDEPAEEKPAKKKGK
jgi:hypothetical protein